MAAHFLGGRPQSLNAHGSPPRRIESDESENGGGARLSSPARTRAGSTTSATSMSSTCGGQPTMMRASTGKLNPGSAPFVPPSAGLQSGTSTPAKGQKHYDQLSATQILMKKIREEFGSSGQNDDQTAGNGSIAVTGIASPQPQYPVHHVHLQENGNVNWRSDLPNIDINGHEIPVTANESQGDFNYHGQPMGAALSPTAAAFQPQLQKIDAAYQDIAHGVHNSTSRTLSSSQAPGLLSAQHGAYASSQSVPSQPPAFLGSILSTQQNGVCMNGPQVQQPALQDVSHTNSGSSMSGQAFQSQQVGGYNDQQSSFQPPIAPYSNGLQGCTTNYGYQSQALQAGASINTAAIQAFIANNSFSQPHGPPVAIDGHHPPQTPLSSGQSGYATGAGTSGQVGVVNAAASSAANGPYNGQPLYINKRTTPIPVGTAYAVPKPNATVRSTASNTPVPGLNLPNVANAHSAGGEKSGYNHFTYKPLPATIEPLYLDNPTEKTRLFEPPTAQIRAKRSNLLNQLVPESGRPELGDLMNPKFFPFMEPAMAAKPVEHGVIHLKNIPFTTTRAEIIALVGRNSRLLSDHEEPVHIIMDRTTSKTNDAYVEFVTMHDAIVAIERCKKGDRSTRLGDRPVEIELGSQAQLMKDLFPFAPGVVWHGAQPYIQPDRPDMPWENFKRFVTSEEMAMLVKHVEVPHRSPFSRTCPERAYDCMISTIKKLPWYMTEHITIKQRHQIFDACAKLMELLLNNLHHERSPDRLTPQLMRRFTNAIMLCPGFTVCQKDNIAVMVSMGEVDMRKFNMPPLAEGWVHQYMLGPKPGIPLDVLEYYIDLICQETTRYVDVMPSRDRQQFLNKSRDTNTYWGYFWREVGFPVGPAFDNITLATAAMLEWSAVDRVLRRAIEIANGANIPSIPGMGDTNSGANGQSNQSNAQGAVVHLNN